MTTLDDTAEADALLSTVPSNRRGAASAARGASRLAAGSIVGRYVILRRLGAGAMGEVFAAHDPSLDRRVALKVLLANDGRSPKSTGDQRLLREAQALARLSHPNVVAVHDVGVHEGAVYIAMEHVDGVTLRVWVDAEPPPWQRVVAAVLAVGGGVAAAHGARLLHRDIKPDNVMLGRDGRVRLMDFGLVRDAQDEDGAPARAREPGLDAVHAFAAALTDGLATPGTPAYMAPELWRGSPATPASDQFALCVTAWELVYGERPFAGKGLGELRRNVLTGVIAEPSTRSRCPRWLHHVLSVGLAPEPGDRYPSVEALLAALRIGTKRERWRRYGRAAVAIFVVGGAALGFDAWEGWKKQRQCSEHAEEIAAVWNDTNRSLVQRAAEQTGLAYGRETAARVIPRINGYVDEWRDARATACMQSQASEASSPEGDQRVTWCLGEQAEAVSTLVSAFIDSPATALPEMVTAVARLTPPAACLDDARLPSVALPPSADSARVQAALRQLTRAQFLGAVAKHTDARVLAESALLEARALAWPRLTALAHYRIGTLSEAQGRYIEAEPSLEAAFFEAMSGDAALDVAFDAAQSLAFLVGDRLARIEDGRRWGRIADAIASARLPDPSRTAQLTRVLGILDRDAGDFAAAATRAREVLALQTELSGAQHPDVGLSLANLASTQSALGEYREATQLYERALEVQTAALGSNHPAVGQTLHNLARVRYQAGLYREAGVLAQRALAIFTDALGPEHPSVESTLGVLGGAQLAAGDLPSARETMKRALAIAESTRGGSHPATAAALGNLGLVEHALGQLGAAIALQRRALLIEETVRGANHPDVAVTRFNLGRSQLAAGEYPDAEHQFARAVASIEAREGSTALGLVEPLVGLTETALAGRQLEQALVHARRAASIASTAAKHGGGRIESLDWARFVLAQALWSASADDDAGAWDRAEALMIGHGVRASVLGRTDAGELLTELDAWLQRCAMGRDADEPAAGSSAQ